MHRAYPCKIYSGERYIDITAEGEQVAYSTFEGGADDDSA